MIKPRKVGTVEILVLRVYPIDPRNFNKDRTEVVVQPGVFDLYRQAEMFFWVMRGEINLRGFQPLGHDIFTVNSDDEGSGVMVEFPSAYFSDVDFRDCLACHEFTEGHPAQRVRVIITDKNTRDELYEG
jgi:hypothetical protein